MAITDEVTTRLGSAILIELTNFDDSDAETVNTSRLAAAVADGRTLIRTHMGLDEPDDTTTDLYASYVALACKAIRYFLLWYKEPEGAETRAALTEFTDQVSAWRPHQDIALVTDSVVDVSKEDTESRRARFAPSHFDAIRLSSRGAKRNLEFDS